MNFPFTCPVCGAPLTPDEKMCRCPNGHPFNIAREGYVNLLLSHQRKSNQPGDDPEMVRARRRFFDSGAFDPLVQAVVGASVFDRPAPRVLDCGCGEGHLLGALSQSRDGLYCGVDISKKTVQLASKRHKGAVWAVANGMRRLPIADRRMDVILSVLAPRNNAEFDRVLAPDGALLVGVPGPHHLAELRQRLQFSSGDFKDKADAAAAKLAPRFVEVERASVRYQRALDGARIADLIRMTPLFWRSGAAAQAAARELKQLTITISLTLLTLRKAGASSPAA